MTLDEAIAAILVRTVDDLPGSWSIQVGRDIGDLFIRNIEAIVVRLDLPAVGKAYGNWVALPASTSQTDDLDPGLIHVLANQLHDAFRPWLRPDPNPMPSFVLLPRIGACEALCGRLRRWWYLSAQPRIATW